MASIIVSMMEPNVHHMVTDIERFSVDRVHAQITE